MVGFFILNCHSLFGSSFECLHHNKHKECRQEAEYDKYRPYQPQWQTAPQETTDRNKSITDSRRYEPTSHHHTFQLGRSYF